jgi:uncharacterized membrane protein YfcA
MGSGSLMQTKNSDSWIDDVPYALIGTLLAVIGFFLGNLVFHQYTWQVVIAPIVGGILGFLASVMTLRSKKLPISATMRDFKNRDSNTGPP